MIIIRSQQGKKIKCNYEKKLLNLVVQTYDILERWYSGKSKTVASDYPLFPYTEKKVLAKKGKIAESNNLNFKNNDTFKLHDQWMDIATSKDKGVNLEKKPVMPEIMSEDSPVNELIFTNLEKKWKRK